MPRALINQVKGLFNMIQCRKMFKTRDPQSGANNRSTPQLYKKIEIRETIPTISVLSQHLTSDNQRQATQTLFNMNALCKDTNCCYLSLETGRLIGCFKILL